MTMKRWDGSVQVDLTTAKRWDGTGQVTLTIGKRWDGSVWSDLGLPGVSAPLKATASHATVGAETVVVA